MKTICLICLVAGLMSGCATRNANKMVEQYEIIPRPMPRNVLASIKKVKIINPASSAIMEYRAPATPGAAAGDGFTSGLATGGRVIAAAPAVTRFFYTHVDGGLLAGGATV